MNDFLDVCIAIAVGTLLVYALSIDEPPNHAFNITNKESRESALAEEAGRPIDPTTGFGNAPVSPRASK